jgi:hypothetical protein
LEELVFALRHLIQKECMQQLMQEEKVVFTEAMTLVKSWTRIQTDNRYWGRASDFADVKADPKNADIVYSANVVTWKSTDGGKHLTHSRAPGGDDYIASGSIQITVI